MFSQFHMETHFLLTFLHDRLSAFVQNASVASNRQIKLRAIIRCVHIVCAVSVGYLFRKRNIVSCGNLNVLDFAVLRGAYVAKNPITKRFLNRKCVCVDYIYRLSFKS